MYALKTDIITVSTMTHAMKAKKALIKRGINARVIKLNTTLYQTGCSYGIEFPSAEFYNAISIIKELGLQYHHLKKD